jgi:signal transduction histidine kinase
MAVATDFDTELARLRACLAVVERHAATHEERMKVLAMKRALDGSAEGGTSETHGAGDDFVGTLCHDLKDPLAAITMGAALLKKQLPEDRSLLALANATRRLDRIIQNARDLDVLRKGAFAPQVRSIPISSLLVPNIERARAAVNARKITIAFEPLEVRVLGDPHATARAFDELLDNAVGFSPENATVRVRVVDDDGVRVQIDDDGPGIDAEHLPHVFDEVKNRAHKPRRGVGRGLPLARAYAQSQDGDVEISVREGGGTRAVLVLCSGS